MCMTLGLQDILGPKDLLLSNKVILLPFQLL